MRVTVTHTKTKAEVVKIINESADHLYNGVPGFLSRHVDLFLKQLRPIHDDGDGRVAGGGRRRKSAADVTPTKIPIPTFTPLALKPDTESRTEDAFCRLPGFRIPADSPAGRESFHRTMSGPDGSLLAATARRGDRHGLADGPDRQLDIGAGDVVYRHKHAGKVCRLEAVLGDFHFVRAAGNGWEAVATRIVGCPLTNLSRVFMSDADGRRGYRRVAWIVHIPDYRSIKYLSLCIPWTECQKKRDNARCQKTSMPMHSGTPLKSVRYYVTKTCLRESSHFEL